LISNSSVLYREIADLLGISKAWILEAMDDLKSVGEDFNALTAGLVPDILHSNWKSLIAYQDKIGMCLVDRIKKTTEVKRPRDVA
jgi:hypothetical protein